jgi:hypothetical protein
MSALALIVCVRNSPRETVGDEVRAGDAGDTAEAGSPEPAELRELRSRIATLEESSELLVEAGTVASGEAVPLPGGGTWRDGSPIMPENWVIAVSPADVSHTWRGTPKSTRCTVDQDTRLVRVYSEKWTYPGEGVDQQGRASYLIVCSRQLARATPVLTAQTKPDVPAAATGQPDGTEVF